MADRVQSALDSRHELLHEVAQSPEQTPLGEHLKAWGIAPLLEPGRDRRPGLCRKPSTMPPPTSSSARHLDANCKAYVDGKFILN